MLKAIIVISINPELEQKLEQKVAPNVVPQEQGPVNFFTAHYPQQLYSQNCSPNYCPQY